MSFDAAPWLGRCTLLLLTLVTILGAGCSPDSFLVADEDRERNFQRARDAERLGDYEGAAEYYERAIEKNPRSPAAHLGYASLCEGALRRNADAVYHYQRYLRLRPDDPKAEDIRRRVTNCIERLATSVPLVIRSDVIARDLAAVRNENRALRSDVTNLVATVAYWSNLWARASAAPLASGLSPGEPGGEAPDPSGPVRSGNSARPARPSSPVPPSSSSSSPGAGIGPSANRLVTTPRSHRVQPGETMERIARRYGVSVAALQRANPQIQPRRMKAGTYLKIPER